MFCQNLKFYTLLILVYSFERGASGFVIQHHPKFIIIMDDISSDSEGIQQVNVVDFLLENA